MYIYIRLCVNKITDFLIAQLCFMEYSSSNLQSDLLRCGTRLKE